MPAQRSSSGTVAGAVWFVIIGPLLVIGILASVGRAAFPRDAAAQGEALRLDVLKALGRDDPFLARRAEEIEAFERPFADHPLATLVHITIGAMFLVLAPLQFLPSIRARFLQFHRWSGRLLVVVGLIAAVTGLFFGLTVPFGGRSESIVILIVGVLFITALIKAVIAIRRRDVARHREWMIRAFAAAMGPSVVRLVVPVVDLTLNGAEFDLRETFALSLWIAWVITSGTAELWIIRTRAIDHATAPIPVRRSPT